MHNSELFDLLVAEANHPFAGWDFSHITATGRMTESPLPWQIPDFSVESYFDKLVEIHTHIEQQGGH